MNRLIKSTTHYAVYTAARWGLNSAVIAGSATALMTLTPTGITTAMVLAGIQRLGVVTGVSQLLADYLQDLIFSPEHKQIKAE